MAALGVALSALVVRLGEGRSFEEDLPPGLAGMLRASAHRRLQGSGLSGDENITDSNDSTEIEEPVEADMWGGCVPTSNTGICQLEEGFACDSFLSPGPADGDVVMELINLPPSQPGADVYLHWWAAFKSESEYEPLTSPLGCSIFKDFNKAYPLHSDTEHFNGGNVRVASNGSARLRVRQPSSYVVNNLIVYPHIHLRLCSGARFSHASADSIFFTETGPKYIRGFHGYDHDSSTLSNWFPTSPGTTAPESGGNATTPRAGTTAASTRATTSGIVGSATTAATATTSAAPIVTSMIVSGGGWPNGPDDFLNDTSGFVDLRIQDAIEALDLDALEFSPVYKCLLRNMVFSYFNSSCVEACPPGSDLHVGQCVRAEVTEDPIRIEASWRLQLECGESCWHRKLNVTMHHLRLAAADKLNIPFQEVERAALVQIFERRLSAEASALATAQMHVVVRSRRIQPSSDEPLLESLLSDAIGAEWLLGFVVRDVQPIDSTETTEDGDTIVVVTGDSDPYADAYDAATGEDDEAGYDAAPGVQGASLPLWTTLAAAVLVLAALFTFFAVHMWKKARKPLDVWGIPVIAGPSEPDEYPLEPSTVGAVSFGRDVGGELPRPSAAPSSSGLEASGTASVERQYTTCV